MRRGINKKIVVQVCLDINARHYLKNTAKRVEGGAQKKKQKSHCKATIIKTM
jgi:hypothetical protein